MLKIHNLPLNRKIKVMKKILIYCFFLIYISFQHNKQERRENSEKRKVNIRNINVL